MRTCQHRVPVILHLFICGILLISSCSLKSAELDSDVPGPSVTPSVAPTITPSEPVVEPEPSEEPIAETAPADPRLERAREILTEMSLEEKAGQVFIARCPDENAAELAAGYSLGGYVLFSDDFENRTKDEVASFIHDIQDASKVKMLMGVDEEGGTVTRLSRFGQYRSSRFKSPQTCTNRVVLS